jgi:serine/threonine-protein kinase RsbW
MSSDRVTLTVPGRGEYAKTVRMTAAELASRIGMSYDDVDDVRMAAEEAFVFACSRVGSDGEITFIMDVGADGLAMAVGPLPDRPDVDAAEDSGDRYAAFILESVCDEFEVRRTDGACTLTLVKRLGVAVEG